MGIDPIHGNVQVEYTLRGPLPPRVRFAFPNRWAGREGFFDDIGAIRAFDAFGDPLHVTINEDRVAAVTLGDGDALTLRYTVRPERGLLTHATRYRALLSADRFFAPGHAVLAEPLDLGDHMAENVQVSIAVPEGVFGERWRIRSTVDLAQPLALEDLIDAAFFAGEFDAVVRERDGRRVELWVEERVEAGAHALGDLTLDVVEAQHALLGEAIAARTVVVVLAREDDPDALNGAGRTGGFVLELGRDVGASTDGIAALVAHENFHRLNGHFLRFAASDEFATMWFREGVTDYVAMRNAAASSVLPRAAFFRFVGRALANYLGSPAANAQANTGSDAYWRDRDVRRLPYDKGALLALLIDLRLRATIDRNIEDFFVWLRERPDIRQTPLSNEVLRDALSEYAGEDWTDFWQRYVRGSDVLPVFERLNAVGLEVVERVEPAPYYGFRASVTVDGAWFVSHVEPGSPADRAGLHVGDALASEPYMPTHPNAERATVYLTRPSGVSTLDIAAGRGQRRTFALSAGDDAYLTAFGLR